MATPRPQRKYSVSQTELYQICRVGWQSYLDNVAAFTALNSNYDAAFGNTALAEIDAAQNLPDFQQRDYVSESLRIQLVAAAQTAITNWKALRSHIAKAFPEPQFETSMEAAGSAYYNDAINEDWEELKQMLTSGQAFITANTAALTAIGMPATFPTDYQTAATAFDNLLSQFMTAEQEGKEGTDEKVNANNALYNKLQAMFADGQLIFEDVPATRDRFIFTQVKLLVSSNPGNDGGEGDNEVTFSGTVTDNVTGMFLADATLESDGEVIATTNVLGQFSITFPITEVLNVQLTIKKTGYNDYVTPIQFSPGTDLEQNFTMQRIILTTYQQNMGQGNYNLGNAPAGTTGLRITLISGSAATVGFSNDGMSFAGNTETVNSIDEPVDRTLAELGGYALYVLAQNNDLNPVTVKVEVLG